MRRTRSRSPPSSSSYRSHSDKYHSSDNYHDSDSYNSNYHNRNYNSSSGGNYNKNYNSSSSGSSNARHSSASSAPSSGGRWQNDGYSSRYSQSSSNPRPQQHQRVKEEPNDRVVLQNLSYVTTEGQIQDALYFMKIRYQEVIVARERQTSAPKGFGFIQFASTEDASIFVDRFFPGFELDGRKVFINYSKQETPEMVDWNCTHCQAFNSRKRDTCWQCSSMKPLDAVAASKRPTRNTGERDISAIPYHELLVRELDPDVTEDLIFDTFQSIAPVKSVRLIEEKETGHSLQFAFVEFHDVAMAAYTLQVVSSMSEFTIGRDPVTANYAQPTSFETDDSGTPKYWDTNASYRSFPAVNIFAQESSKSAPSFDVVVPPEVKTSKASSAKSEKSIDDDLAAFYADIGGLISPDGSHAERDAPAIGPTMPEPKPVTVMSAPPVPAAIPAEAVEALKKKKAVMDKKVQEQLNRWKAKVEEQQKEDEEEESEEDDSGGSGEEKDDSPPIPTDDDFADYSRSACLLCQRGFKSVDDLRRHQQLSELHKTNMANHLDKFHSQHKSKPKARPLAPKAPVAPKRRPRKQRSTPKEKGYISVEQATKIWESQKEQQANGETPAEAVAPSLKGGAGSKLLEKMGWKEGQGLGKDQAGITAPVIHETYSSKAGVGAGVLLSSTTVADLAMGDRKQKTMMLTKMRLEESNNR